MIAYRLRYLVALSKDPKRPKKATQALTKLRVNEIYGLLTRGHSRKDIIQHVSEKHQLGERQIDELIRKARDIIEQDCALSRPEFLAECLAGLRFARKGAEKHGNWNAYLTAIKMQADFSGITKDLDDADT